MTHFINGDWLKGSGNTFFSINPADQTENWQGSEATPKEVEQAIQAAREAYESWGSLPLDKRVDYLKAFQAQLQQEKENLAQIIASETGKPIWESSTEVGAMIGKIDISIKAYHDRTGIKETEIAGGVAATRHKPHGVLAVFGPYNFPGHLPNGHIVPALLAGNTIVFKPSELTPKTAEETVKIWHQAGIPAGVINLLQGQKETGIALASHPQLDGLLFTGSANTGYILNQQYGSQPEKILALEMGGNNPLVIGKINDIKAAVYLTLQSAYISAGQRCTCARRLFVSDNDLGEQFIQQLIAAIKAIQIGKPHDNPAPFMGPVITKQAAEQLLTEQQELLSQGATPLLTMEQHSLGPAFLSPGVIDVTTIKNRADKELFGPLLQLIRYKNLAEAIAEANNTRYGLAAGLFSDDEIEYQQFYQQIRAGIVNWNKQLTGASSAAPFGGVGASGNHRPSAYYAADYCAYPVASMETKTLELPENFSPGISL